MEIGLASKLPTYSGGLGVLAGDTLRSAADLGIDMVAVTLLPREGYLRQRIDAQGRQTEEPERWSVAEHLVELPHRVSVQIEGRTVTLRPWLYEIEGINGHQVPVYFLDADLAGNAKRDRAITNQLYGGDSYMRLCQEAILGIGGIRMLRSLGHDDVSSYHMNEGHSSLLILELLAERMEEAGESTLIEAHVEAVRKRCVFTTHTPVLAGHDSFPLKLAQRVLRAGLPFPDGVERFCVDGELNLTHLALDHSRYINGVAKRHAEVAREMFDGYTIDSITNGIHLATWTTEPFGSLFDRHIPAWREDSASLRWALKIPSPEIWDAHRRAKRTLIDHTNRAVDANMDPSIFTIGFARRATPYKRADLLLSNVERLQAVARSAGRIQVIYAGKAHPQDDGGKEIIQRIHQVRDKLGDDVKIAYIPNYDMELGKLLTSGTDLWLSTAEPPLEASGTSGMKAAINAVPSLGVLDGWWAEGCIEGITGWAIGEGAEAVATDPLLHADAIYDKLEQVILPMYHHDREGYVSIMRNAIAVNGSFFNTERMISQYVAKAYFR